MDRQEMETVAKEMSKKYFDEAAAELDARYLDLFYRHPEITLRDALALTGVRIDNSKIASCEDLSQLLKASTVLAGEMPMLVAKTNAEITFDCGTDLKVN